MNMYDVLKPKKPTSKSIPKELNPPKKKQKVSIDESSKAGNKQKKEKSSGKNLPTKDSASDGDSDIASSIPSSQTNVQSPERSQKSASVKKMKDSSTQTVSSLDPKLPTLGKSRWLSNVGLQGNQPSQSLDTTGSITEISTFQNNVVRLPPPFDHHLVLFFHPRQRFYFIGNCHVMVHRGMMRIQGSTMCGGSSYSQPLHSPPGTSAIYMECIGAMHVNSKWLENVEREEMEGDLKEQIEKIIREHDQTSEVPHEAVVIIRTQSGRRLIEEENRPFPKMIDFDAVLSWETRVIQVDDSWHRVELHMIDSFEAKKPNIVMMGGPSGSGKSTTARCLVNLLLDMYGQVAFFEGDPGQCEFTPPGQISMNIVERPIIGPPWTHLQAPITSRYFGGSSAGDDPEHYVQCLRQVWNNFKKHPKFGEIPVVVNTMGWVVGQGLQMLQELYDITKPDTLVEMHRPGSRPIMLTSTDDREEAKHIILTGYRKVARGGKISAKDKRDLALTRYFGQDVHVKPVASIKWKYLRMSILFESVKPSQTFWAINASLIGLCIDRSAIRFSDDRERKFVEEEELPVILQEQPLCECVGLGIVRSVDMANRQIHISTPLSMDVLSQVNTILRGNIELPNSLACTPFDPSERPYMPLSTIKLINWAGDTVAPKRNW
ncbi:polynucleotide 5'-hydroxyl-kinase NOL9-like [Planoprotostelium fungivorum]|uniref:Polynucleotide 5'-hydroxyl-kinase NOL9-like n=1 Tax=Planoprotostelium fungivorum TaxID=1890364 RepID=A0A2P6NK25_9EUKA|nr:polynucleotide 5'-hydroxyl-kinase NOL9-like [Planoprotostelium fungivorum]